MAKKRRQQPVVGDAFAIPLEGGRYAVCRVRRVRDGVLFVANAAWFGTEVPSPDDPALRPVLRLTHLGRKRKASAVWVGGPPPDDFIHIGNIPPGPDDKSIKTPDFGGWPFFRIQAQAQWLWEHPEDVPAGESES